MSSPRRQARVLRRAFVLGSLALGACASLPEGPTPPPMVGEEVAQRARVYCRRRGYACNVIAVQSDGPLWSVDLYASSRHASGNMHIEYDMRGWRLVRADEPASPPPPEGKMDPG